MRAIVEMLIRNPRKKQFIDLSIIIFISCMLIFYSSTLTIQDKHFGIFYAYQY